MDVLDIILLVWNNLLNQWDVIVGVVATLTVTLTRFSKVLKEIKEALDSITQATQPDADGKVRLTKAELEKVAKEVQDVIGLFNGVKTIFRGKKKS